MQPDAFEQLVSEWLDQPGRSDLRARIDAAISASPALAVIWEDWTRLDQLLRDATALPRRVDWRGVQSRIAAAIAAEAGAHANSADATAELDAALSSLPAIDDRVDWDRTRRRIVAAVHGRGEGTGAVVEHGSPTSDRPRRRIIPIGVAMAALAAAAALLLMVTPWPVDVNPRQHEAAPVDRGFAQATISKVGELVTGAGAGDKAPIGRAVAAIIPLDESTDVAPGHTPEALPVVFLMVEPPASASGAGVAELLGSI